MSSSINRWYSGNGIGFSLNGIMELDLASRPSFAMDMVYGPGQSF